MTLSSDKNFGLNKEEFTKMVHSLQCDDDILFEKVFLNHFQNCMNYLQRKYSASYDESYDASMDATIEFRLRLIDEKIYFGNLRYLYTKMAVQFLLRNRKSYNNVSIEGLDIIEEEAADEEDLIKLKESWESLGEDCRSLLRLNFYSNMKLRDIAELNEKSAVAVRKQKERCLSKLIEIFFKL